MKRARLIVLLAALAVAAAFVAPLDGGRPLFDFAAVKGMLGAASARAPIAGGEGGGAYKWQDEDGTWHFSNVRPEGRRGVQKVKEAVTWAAGSGAAAPTETAEPDGDRPRSAADLLAESRRLEGKAGARESEVDRLVREAQE